MNKASSPVCILEPGSGVGVGNGVGVMVGVGEILGVKVNVGVGVSWSKGEGSLREHARETKSMSKTGKRKRYFIPVTITQAN